MRIFFRHMSVCLILLGATNRCCAQQFTVQQPVIGHFGVRTTLSVPDRGVGLLGSVGRRGTSRFSAGPFRSGSSIGQFTEHRGATVSVYIHDLAELDRQLLASSTTNPESPTTTYSHSTGRVDSRFHRLLAARAAKSGRAQNKLVSPRASAPDRVTSIANTAYGRARLSQRQNLDRMLYRVRRYK